MLLDFRNKTRLGRPLRESGRRADRRWSSLQGRAGKDLTCKAKHPRAETRDAPRRILVVEDCLDTAWSLTTLLQLAGHDARIACDADSALAMADQHPPDCFLIDIGLPGRNGCDLAGALRQDARFRDAALIAASGFSPTDLGSAPSLFDHYLIKPIDFQDLRTLLSRPTQPR